MQRFNPELDVIQPTASSRGDHIGTVRISWKGRVVHVLFHEAAHPDRPGWLLLVDSALIQLSVVLLRSLSS